MSGLHHPRRWRWSRRLAVLLVVCLVLVLGFTYVRPVSGAGGRSGISLDRGALGLFRSSDPLVAGHPWWQMGTSRVVTAPRSPWYPTTSTATISVVSVPPVTMRLYALYIPLWNLIVIAAAAAGFAHIRLRRLRRPDRCPRCGYDVSGITGRCPECGHGIEAGAVSGVASAPVAR